MISLRGITNGKTGLALSALTVFVMAVGYAAVRWLSGSRQAPPLEQLPSAVHAGANRSEPPLLILKPNVPDGAITTGWDSPLEETPIDTAARERELR